ncbi:Protein-L-isoaspartate O-methyltransferase [Streptomyces griseus]
MSTAPQVPTYPALVQELADGGLLTARWRQVFDAVPRSGFVPADVWRQLPDRCEPVVGTDAWLALVNSDEPVVTQLDDGAEDGPGIATSSNSMPSMVARMLGLLDIEDGQHVVEIGTGTGYVPRCCVSGSVTTWSTASSWTRTWHDRRPRRWRRPGTGRTCALETANNPGPAWDWSTG